MKTQGGLMPVSGSTKNMNKYCTSSPWCDDDCCKCDDWAEYEEKQKGENPQEVEQKELTSDNKGI